MFQIYTGAKQCHQLVFILGDVSLHDVHTGTQQTLKCLNVDYWKEEKVSFRLFGHYYFMWRTELLSAVIHLSETNFGPAISQYMNLFICEML